MWDIGFVEVDGIPFTSLERTLVEYLVNQKKVSPNEAHSALIKALQRKKVKPWDVARVAEQMGHTQKIAKYLEPFLYVG